MKLLRAPMEGLLDHCLRDVLTRAGVLDPLAGVVFGAFTNCNSGDGCGTLTLDEVFDDDFKPLDIPVYRGAHFGHIERKFTLPIGLPVEMDAAAGTMRLLSPAVAWPSACVDRPWPGLA